MHAATEPRLLRNVLFNSLMLASLRSNLERGFALGSPNQGRLMRDALI